MRCLNTISCHNIARNDVMTTNRGHAFRQYWHCNSRVVLNNALSDG